LVLRYNPQWTDADFPGNRTIQHPWSTRDFKLVTYMVSKASIAKILGGARSTLHHFIQSRHLG